MSLTVITDLNCLLEISAFSVESVTFAWFFIALITLSWCLVLWVDLKNLKNLYRLN